MTGSGTAGRRALALWLVLAACAWGRAGEGPPGDARPEPGAVALAWERRLGDLVIRQYEVHGLAQLSYVLGAGGEAVVVDPIRDVDTYVRDAAALGLEITRVVLTHGHADFVAGHTELAGRTGAEVVTACDLDASETHWTLGDTRVSLRALDGGPHDALLVRVGPAASPDTPACVLTGDACLVGTVACPEDAPGGTAALDLAAQAYDAVQDLRTMPDGTLVLPAHGAGRFGGRKLPPYTVSTIGRERATNPFFRVESRAAFLGRLLDLDAPTAPGGARILRLNREGPPRVEGDAAPVAIDAHAAAALADPWFLDVREHAAYAAGHVRGAVNIPRSGPLEAWVPYVLPPEARVVLVGEPDATSEVVRRLHRVGTRVHALLRGGMKGWADAGLPVQRSEEIEPKDLARRRGAGIEPLLVDVRSPAEHAEARIADCVNVPLEEPARLVRLLGPGTSCLLICKTDYRSGIAVGLAERAGADRAANLRGGMRAWRAAGLPVIGSAVPAAGGPAER